jgi:60S ribosome subunit biogenesis protein NIP7
MRPLTDEETKLVFEKLVKYIGKKITYMVDNEENNFVFRLHKNRVYYCNEEMIKFVINFEKKKLISFGTCLGKFTKTGKFRLNITALDYLAKYAQYKIWLKPNGEQLYLYGHHVIKSHIERISEDTPVHAGVVIFNIKDVPLGFVTTAKSAMDLKNAEPNNIIVYNQADIGEYLRVEEDN